jgi:hypothetical protein
MKIFIDTFGEIFVNMFGIFSFDYRNSHSEEIKSMKNDIFSRYDIVPLSEDKQNMKNDGVHLRKLIKSSVSQYKIEHG